MQNAIQRIDKLVEEIYEVKNCKNNDFLIAKDKLSEIQLLIEKNEIEGLPRSKYIDVKSYMNDLEILTGMNLSLYNLRICKGNIIFSY